MEYVKGVPITDHCDRYKLAIEERLKLFMTVCEAVQYAHQKAIIHRNNKLSIAVSYMNLSMSIYQSFYWPTVVR